MSARRRLLLGALFVGLATAAIAGAHRLVTTAPETDATQPGRSGADLDVVCFGYIDLEHGTTPLLPVVSGRVARVAVHENEVVSAGAVLLTLDDTAARLRVQEAQASLEVAQAQLARAEQLPAQHKLKLTQQQSAVEAADHRLSAAKNLVTVKQKLLKDKFISAPEAAAAEDLVRELEALRKVESAKLDELRQVNPQLEVRAADAEVKRARVKVREAEQALAECTLKAPQAGTVLRVLVTPGELTGGSGPHPAILFGPDEPRIVRAELPQEFADRVKPGRKAEVLDDTSAGHLGHGKVSRLSDWFLRRRQILLEPTRFNDARTLECLITFDSGERRLRIGQRVQVRIATGPDGANR